MAEFQSAPPSTSTPQPKPRTPQQSVRKTQLKLIAAAIIAVILIFGTLGAVGLFGNSAEQLLIRQINFNFSCSSSQVFFTVTNSGPVDVTVSQVQAVQVAGLGQVSTTVLTGNVLPKGASTTLTAFFPGLVFTGGAIYTFSLLTSHGSAFSSGALVPSVTVVDQFSINQVTFNGGSQVTFAISNPGTCDLNVASATVRGGGVNGTLAGTILSGGLVPSGGSSSLSVNFSGATFNSGTRYTFVLTSARGVSKQVQATA